MRFLLPRPFLRRQESHSVVCHNSPIRPRFPVPPEDHSCEGRNLKVSCATIRRFAPDSPFPRKTIPTKAGISQCRVPQFADSLPIPIPPEDHSCEGRNLIAMGGIAALITPPLAAHNCEIPAYAGMVFRGTGVYRQKYARLLPVQLPKSPPIPIPPAAHSCEGRNLTVSDRRITPIRRHTRTVV